MPENPGPGRDFFVNNSINISQYLSGIPKRYVAGRRMREERSKNILFLATVNEIVSSYQYMLINMQNKKAKNIWRKRK